MDFSNKQKEGYLKYTANALNRKGEANTLGAVHIEIAADVDVKGG
jgi:hypothetical protein